MHSEHDLQERQRRTNHSESFPLWGATFLHNPWHQGPEARWMPYAPLRRRRRPLREYSFPPIFHKSPRFPCRQRGHKKWRRRRRTSPAQRYYITPEGGSTQPACKAKPITGRTLAAQGQRPGGWLNPHARKGVSTFGNTGKHRAGPDPDRAERRLNPQAPKGLSLLDNFSGR